MNEAKRRQRDLVRTLEVQTASYNQGQMMNFILQEVKNIAPKASVRIHEGNIYVHKGDAETYPCVVSHMDTVHSIHPNSRVFNYNGKLFSIDFQTMNRIGTGGDDKVGVFVCLEMLREFDAIKLAFFRDEEVGCVGSGVADMDFFKDVAFALQCDRKGYRDFVNSISATKLYTKDFSKAIEGTLKKWGKKETSGGLTDVYQLAENGIGVCVANMSCGYHDPHTDNEYCIVDEVMDTRDFVQELIETIWTDGERWEIAHDVWSNYRSYGGYGRYGYGDGYEYTGYGKGWSKSRSQGSEAEWISGDEMYEEEEDETLECPCCGETHASYYDPTEQDYYCYNCQAYHNELECIMDELQAQESLDDPQGETPILSLPPSDLLEVADKTTQELLDETDDSINVEK